MLTGCEKDISTLNKGDAFETPRYHRKSIIKNTKQPNLQRSSKDKTQTHELKSTDTRPSHTPNLAGSSLNSTPLAATRSDEERSLCREAKPKTMKRQERRLDQQKQDQSIT
ncbi:unnamed protein product [Arabis nemorensis]|uniref:Uncharacterized protein n=1 Tax=Arabis nemorensis TaxID=586526 RepID=A0A565BCK1_9BRAS|nr:unnamed protein product [Arabis nemorensis]